jgi:hypothetical protein
MQHFSVLKDSLQRRVGMRLMGIGEAFEVITRPDQIKPATSRPLPWIRDWVLVYLSPDISDPNGAALVGELLSIAIQPLEQGTAHAESQVGGAVAMVPG